MHDVSLLICQCPKELGYDRCPVYSSQHPQALDLDAFDPLDARLSREIPADDADLMAASPEMP